MEEEMATHSRILAWKIPWTEDPGRLQPKGSQESDTTEQLNTHRTQTSKKEYNQAGANDFQHLIWIFGVCQLSPTW